jgi:hypothetical protein
LEIEVAKMKIQMKRDLRDHYLVLSEHETDVLNSYQTRMLNENTISGLLSCHTEHIDDEIMLCYNVTSRQPLSEIVADRLIDGRLLRLVLESLLDTLNGLGEFLLPSEGIVLSPDCIFADSLLSEIRFCYFPGRGDDFSDSLRIFSEFLLPRLDHDDRDAVMLGYSFYQSCINDTLTEDTFARLLYGRQDSVDEGAESSAAGAVKESTPPFRNSGGADRECGGSEHLSESEQEPAEESEVRRRQILDDFFADDDEEEEVDPEVCKTIHFTVISAGIAAAVALLIILTGNKDTGIGIGILLFSGAILTRRVHRKIRERSPAGRSIRDEKQQPEDAFYSEVPPDNRTSERYEQRCFFSKEKEQGSCMEGPRSCADEADARIQMPDYLADHYRSKISAGNEETVLLSDFAEGGEKVRARLISLDDRNEAPHILSADEYRIGKSETASDIVLPSEAVSRLHAKIVWKKDHYELRDMRSKNATFINETMLDAGEDTALKDGDCCRFADRVYRYRTGGY